MKTIIYYFTGTGNSLAAARKIAVILGDCEVAPIASLSDTGGEITPAAERVGIISPVYFYGLPVMVAEFATRLRTTRARYLFSVVTHGGGGGVSTLQQLDGILQRQASRGLDAGFTVQMPGNYILMYESPKGEKRAAMLAAADRDITRISNTLRQNRKEGIRRSFFRPVLHTLLYPRFIKNVREQDRKFSVTDKCTACGTCMAICPAKNIELVDNRPVFQHHCELCCGCIHNCPVRAIQAGTKTEKRERYRNPDVTVADLKLRKGELL